jgi:hypothetical protein
VVALKDQAPLFVPLPGCVVVQQQHRAPRTSSLPEDLGGFEGNGNP